MQSEACIFVFVKYIFLKRVFEQFAQGRATPPSICTTPKYSCLQMCLTSVAWANVEAGIYHLNDERRFLFIGITTKKHLTNTSNHRRIPQ